MKIKQIGIELEGAWIKKPRWEDLQLHPDGSVHIDGACNCSEANCEKYHYVGECVSLPLDYLELAKAWLDRTYPNKSNKTCGMHIHLSFVDKLSYMRLMSKNFYNYFLTRANKWGIEKNINEGTIFWERLTGQNTFCNKKFMPEKQIKMKSKSDGERYTHLNFCYAQHKTLECRLFPTFQNKELSLSALELYMDIVETFLSRQIREKTIEESIIDDSDEPTVKGDLLCV